MNILVADDHAIVRKGMKQLLLEQYPFAQIGEASNVEQMITMVINNNWDVVICDINMPGRSGLDALKQIKEISPSLPVLIMSMSPEDQYAVRVLKAGAAGYLGKETIHDDLIQGIEKVVKGKKFITQRVAELLANEISNKSHNDLHQSLSDREFDVFKLLAAGLTVSKIAEKLLISTTTVSTYRSRIMEKMNLKSNAEFARYAVEKGLI